MSTRRDFLRRSGASLAALSLPACKQGSGLPDGRPAAPGPDEIDPRDLLPPPTPAQPRPRDPNGTSGNTSGGGQPDSPSNPEDVGAGDPEAPIAPADEDFKALVLVFLAGGNDAFNMLVPRSTTEHAQYADARLQVAIPREMLLPITPASSNGVDYGLNPAMPQLASLFQDGRAGILANVGTLTEPGVTRDDVRNRPGFAPPRLFSHNDQSAQWQKTSPAALESIGWAGRVADLMEPTVAAAGQVLPINLSLAGANTLQNGQDRTALELSTRGGQSLSFLRRNPALRDLYTNLLAASNPHLFVGEYARSHKRGLELNAQVSAALETAPELPLSFAADQLGRQLAAVARLISVRQALGARRQIYFVRMGGFDTHADQLQRHMPLLASLSENLDIFYRSTEMMGVAGNVTTVTASDFGRSLTVNGDGTDHGWGSHQLVVGGAVRGGEIYGRMPEMVAGGPEDFRGGRFIPSTSVEQYGATVLKWLGMAAGDMDQVFPNIGRFSTPDLGMLG